MLVFLVVMLCINLIVFYNVFNKNLMSPTFLFTFGLIFSSLLALFVQSKWGFHFEIDTVFIVYISDVCFFLGEIVVYPYFAIRRYSVVKKGIQPKSDKFYCLCTVISFALVVVYINGLIDAALQVGWNGDIISLLYYVRRATQYSDNISVGRLASWCFNLLEAYAFYSAFSIFFLNNSRQSKIALALSMIMYLFGSMLSAGRLPIVIFFFSCIVYYCIKIYQNKGISKKTNKFIIYKMIPVALVFTLVFLIIGVMRRNHENDQNEGRSTFETIAVYAGSGIIGLNQHIVQNGYRSDYVGQTTLNAFFKILNKLGANFPIEKNTLDFIYITPQIKTNIYSAFGRLVPDYGIAGCFIIIFFMGVLYTFFYYMICNSCRYGTLLYGVSVYPLFLVGIEEVFLVRLLSIEYIVIVVFLFIIYNMFRMNWKGYFKVCTK